MLTGKFNNDNYLGRAVELQFEETVYRRKL